ncbi:hypothetical protein AWB80_04416 [Caballeronia pedi]|uniref:Toxin VasX N-terminal region domain-containing protein n=1 Tax=Caballeronia pedi TaxID=1777141 RepID=A0A158C0Z0_9BURK|nr:T6SS effector BTH_I2691 family protein [Caballeronia pedi]SAK76025.1 hypothetical protein AWB80_04416 [Caballeronia pedi]
MGQQNEIGCATNSSACAPHIPIIPVRYAVIPKNPGDTAQFAYADAPYPLEKGFTGIANLNCSKYTLRLLRPGYVYVFMESPQARKLVIHEHVGGGHYRELLIKDLEAYGKGKKDKKRVYAEGARTINVWADLSATQVWIGYSAHLWTATQAQRIESSEDERALCMHKLDMKEFIQKPGSPSTQAHVLPVDAMETWVEDCKPVAKRPELKWSSAPYDKAAFEGMGLYHALAAGWGANRPKIPVVVALLDAEGIAQDLGAIQALLAHQVADLKAPGVEAAAQAKPATAPANNAADSGKLPPALKLDVQRLTANSENFHHKNLMAMLIEQTLLQMYPPNASKSDPATLARLRHESYSTQYPQRRVPSCAELQYEVLTDERLSPAGERFAQRIDKKKYTDFLQERAKADAEIERLFVRIEQASADHDGWLGSAENAQAANRLSVAAALRSYDRDKLISATALEYSIALILEGAGMPLSGREDKDPRTKRIASWVNDTNSPLYLGILAFAPFAKDAGSAGNLLNAANETIRALGSKFEANAATDVIVRNLSQYILTKIPGQTKWTKSPSLVAQVDRAVADGNIKKLLGQLRPRYNLIDEIIAADALSAKTKAMIDNGMLEVEKSVSKVSTDTGSKVVRVITSEELHLKAGKGLPPEMPRAMFHGAVAPILLVFNAICLKDAALTLAKDHSGVNSTNFLAALMGMTAAINVALVATRDLVKRRATNAGVAFAGEAFEKGLLRRLASDGFGRFAGWGGVIGSFATDIQKAWSANSDARNYRVGAAFANAAGGAMVVESALIGGYLTAATGASTIPFAGWVVAAGILLIAGGTWLALQADAMNNTPMERWVTQGIFGNLHSDGDNDSLTSYGDNVSAEIQGYYDAYYAPVTLTAKQSKTLGWVGVDTDWHGHYFDKDDVEFTVLLPGFVVGLSDLQINMGPKVAQPPHQVTVGPDGVVNLSPVVVSSFRSYDTSYRVVNGGLLARAQKGQIEALSAELKVTYWPHQGIDADVSVLQTFELHA